MQMRREVVFAAAGTNNNVLQGLSMEFVKADSLVTLAATATVAGFRTTLRLTDEVSLDDATVQLLLTGPVLPDHILVGKAFANAGEHLLLSVIAPAAGTFVYILDVSPI